MRRVGRARLGVVRQVLVDQLRAPVVRGKADGREQVVGPHRAAGMQRAGAPAFQGQQPARSQGRCFGVFGIGAEPAPRSARADAD
ncbi:MAG: hypothetical protein K0S81_4119 [Rhodospirillales bacterium]|nr:hypothetical protein [Rhodospirillales bacterium]